MSNIKIDKDGNVFVIEMSSYVKPEIQELVGRKWVLNGKDNTFFHYIIDRYNGSPTNESVINVYCQLIYGKGIAVNGQDEIFEDLVEIFPKREILKCIKDFKLFGQYDMQILRAKAGGVAKILHLPTNKLGMDKADENGNINGVWLSEDWTNTWRLKPKFIPAFRIVNGQPAEAISVKSVRPYQAGKFYFSDPDYLAGLQYAELEEEISNFSVNHIKNSLSFGSIINFNNGAAQTPEMKKEVIKKVNQKFSGSSVAGNTVFSFNDSKETETTVVPIEVGEAHSQFEFLSKESMTKILTAHGVTSPLLFGLPSAGGFGANADELDTASKLLQDYQINPKQSVFIDELAPILELNGIETDLLFIPLRDTYTSTEVVDNNPTDDTVDDEEVELKLNEDFELYDILDSYALDTPEGYELADEAEYDLQLASGQTSSQDTKLWKVRYKYVKGNKISIGNIPKGGHRAFCTRMLFLASKGKVFRVEDIKLMSLQGINGKFAHSGGKYDIFKFAGGVNCYHIWERRIFKKKLNLDGTPKKGAALATTTQVNVNEAKRQGWKHKGVPNPKDVAIAEIDKPNNGRFSLSNIFKTQKNGNNK